MCELLVTPPLSCFNSFSQCYWRIEFIKYNYSKNIKDKIVSVTTYDYRTNDIDLKIIYDYRDGVKKAKKHLIKLAKKFGNKTIEKV